MKIIDNEEREAHIAHITTEGIKGLVYGSVASAGLYAYLKIKHPVKFRSFNTSIKTCIITMPTISAAAFWADQGSWEFDKQMHQSHHTQAKVLEEYRKWNQMSLSDQIFSSLNTYKYQIIFGAWAGSMYGSWVYVNRDKVLTTAQKAVQARMYAQAITIVLLLGSMLLAMKERQMNAALPPPVPEWKKVLQQKEEEAEKVKEEKK